MTAAPQPRMHTVTLLSGAAELLQAMRDKATEPLLQRNLATSKKEADQLVREAVLTTTRWWPAWWTC